MLTTEIKQKFEATLKKANLGYESMNVFGTIRLNVHITCVSRDTADKWAMLLAGVFKGKKIYVGETMWEAVENKGTNLRPTMRKGFLISANS